MNPSDTPAFLERIRQDWAQVRPELDPSPMLLMVTLGRLQSVLARQIERTYLPADINPASWDLLITLYRSAPPEGLTPTQLTELTAITGPSMTNRIDRLLDRGLVERQASPADRRSVRVLLTAPGRELVEGLLAPHLANGRHILSALTPQEMQELERLALKLLAHLESPLPAEVTAG